MQKVLIVTYYWPPAGGPGVQRWLKFSTYLPDFGLAPVVFVPKNPSYPILDQHLLEEVPNGIEVIWHPIKEPYQKAAKLSLRDTQTISSGIIPTQEKQSLVQKALLFIRGNFFIPDARKGWVNPSVKFLSEYLEKHQINTMITTGPPHSLHLIGLQLKQKFNLHWIADFRDPWTTISYHRELKLLPKAKKKHLRLEKEVLEAADHIITTSFTTGDEFKHKTKTPLSVITNGFEHEADPTVSLDKPFSLMHIGSLLSTRNPQVLWKVLADLVKENTAFAENFQLRLAGKVSQEVIHAIEQWGLSSYLKLEGYVSHQEAIHMQQKAQVLLLIEANTQATKAIIPGKLFEYLAAKRPILAIGPRGWDVERIIEQTQSGDVLRYDEAKELKQLLLKHFEHYQAGRLHSLGVGLGAYHRKSLTKKLSEIIYKLTDQ